MVRQQGRIAVVTGGARGIGAATCRRLADDGATVVVLDVDEVGAQAIADELPHGGAGLHCDITDQDEVESVVRHVVARFGTIDVLVNNAAIIRSAPFLETSRRDWDAVIEVNLTGAFLMTQVVARTMCDRGYGRIVFVSSLAALGNPLQTHYSSAKAGISGMARTIALELGPFGVTSNVVAPGFVETEMAREGARAKGHDWDTFRHTIAERTAVRRIGQSADIAAAVAFMALPENGFVTGQVLHVTGGPVA